MNKRIKASLFAAVGIVACLGSVKAYDAYQHSTMSDAELLFMENLSALSEKTPPGMSVNMSKLIYLDIVDETGACWSYGIDPSKPPVPIIEENKVIGYKYYFAWSKVGEWVTCTTRLATPTELSLPWFNASLFKCTPKDCTEGVPGSQNSKPAQNEGWFTINGNPFL